MAHPTDEYDLSLFYTLAQRAAGEKVCYFTIFIRRHRNPFLTPSYRKGKKAPVYLRWPDDPGQNPTLENLFEA